MLWRLKLQNARALAYGLPRRERELSRVVHASWYESDKDKIRKWLPSRQQPGYGSNRDP
jgi:hypothetical protein